MRYIFAIIGLLFGIVGLFTMTVVTQGVGLISFGCLICLLVRINQQDRHHEEMINIHKAAHKIIETK